MTMNPAVSTAFQQLSVVVLCHQPPLTEALLKTCETAAGAREILIADAAGLDLGNSTLPAACTQLPLIGLPELVLRYQSALAATGDWVLFLHPGEQITEAWQAAIVHTLQETAMIPKAYCFSRQIQWQDIVWEDPPTSTVSDLIPRLPYLEAVRSGNTLPAESLSAQLMVEVPSDNVFAWIETQAKQQAETVLRQEGAVSLKQRLPRAWVGEIARLALKQGLFEGHWFGPPAQRMALILQLIKTHADWLHRYRLLQASP